MKGKDNSNEGLMENRAPTILFIIGPEFSLFHSVPWLLEGEEGRRKRKEKGFGIRKTLAHHQHRLLMNWPGKSFHYLAQFLDLYNSN